MKTPQASTIQNDAIVRQQPRTKQNLFFDPKAKEFQSLMLHLAEQEFVKGKDVQKQQTLL